MAAQEDLRSDLTLKDKGSLVDALWHAVDGAAGNLEAVPGLVRQVLETGAWRKRQHRGRVFEHDRFVDFIVAKPLAGCGWPVDKVEALIRDEPETLAMWREAVTLGPGKPSHNADNISVIDGHGTSRSYTLSRLKHADPSLFKRVVDGELSANAAAIEAGFRKKPSPFEQVQKLIPKLTAQQRKQLIEMLSEGA